MRDMWETGKLRYFIQEVMKRILNKIEARFDEWKQKMNSLKKNVKMLKINLIILSKYRLHIEK